MTALSSPPLPSSPFLMQISRDAGMFAPDPQPLSSLREFRSEMNLARMTNFDSGEWAGLLEWEGYCRSGRVYCGSGRVYCGSGRSYYRSGRGYFWEWEELL